jgi:hypothetical protein
VNHFTPNENMKKRRDETTTQFSMSPISPAESTIGTNLKNYSIIAK